MPGPSRSISKEVPQNEKCVICLMAPQSILQDFRDKQKAIDPQNFVQRVIITINNDGGIAILLDIHRQAHVLTQHPEDKETVDNLV